MKSPFLNLSFLLTKTSDRVHQIVIHMYLIQYANLIRFKGLIRNGEYTPKCRFLKIITWTLMVSLIILKILQVEKYLKHFFKPKMVKGLSSYTQEQKNKLQILKNNPQSEQQCDIIQRIFQKFLSISHKQQGLVLWCLTPLSKLFQLYRGGQFFYCWRNNRRKAPIYQNSQTNFIT